MVDYYNYMLISSEIQICMISLHACTVHLEILTEFTVHGLFVYDNSNLGKPVSITELILLPGRAGTSIMHNKRYIDDMCTLRIRMLIIIPACVIWRGGA